MLRRLLTCALLAGLTVSAGCTQQIVRPRTTANGAQLFPKMGPHQRAITTSSRDAQRYFDQGLAWAYAFNHDRVKSLTARKHFDLPQSVENQTRRAYVISIGVNLFENPSWNLEYAANDARYLNRTLAEHLAQSGSVDEVIPLVLVAERPEGDSALSWEKPTWV